MISDHIHNYTEYNEEWNVFSAFNPSKCTHLEQWAADIAAPGEQSWTSCQSRDSNPQPWVTSGFKSNALPGTGSIIRGVWGRYCVFLLGQSWRWTCNPRLWVQISAPAGIAHDWGETLEQGTEPPTAPWALQRWLPTAPGVCALGWVKCREHISLLVILCIIVYVTNKQFFLT